MSIKTTSQFDGIPKVFIPYNRQETIQLPEPPIPECVLGLGRMVKKNMDDLTKKLVEAKK